MRWVVLRDDSADGSADAWPLREALADYLLGALLNAALEDRRYGWGIGGPTILTVPAHWQVNAGSWMEGPGRCQRTIPACKGRILFRGRHTWMGVLNGRYLVHVDRRLVSRVLDGADADVVALHVTSSLSAAGETVRLAGGNRVAGFHRHYMDSAEPALLSEEWPHGVFLRSAALDRVVTDEGLSERFADFAVTCRANGLTVRAMHVAGSVLDLRCETGWLDLCTSVLMSPEAGRFAGMRLWGTDGTGSGVSGARIVGPVLLGQDVQIGRDAVILGPTVIADGAKIADQAVVDRSIIGPGVQVPSHQVVQNRFVWNRVADSGSGSGPQTASSQVRRAIGTGWPDSRPEAFRTWGLLSYARFGKRMVDFAFAAIVLLLFAPILAIVALAVKGSSSGPVFYRARRQGLHGQPFDCLKFRTMRTDADAIQGTLRVANEVDGPQFKMEDDPRTTVVGRFLRETCIDEIPQFFNVLVGQMSVVGPRPSPESENTQCPFWRDARLSVRPGITGFWQVRRTRMPGQDFQEWIHYDVQYVRHLSAKMDLWICARTFMKLVDKFIEQF